MTRGIFLYFSFCFIRTRFCVIGKELFNLKLCKIMCSVRVSEHSYTTMQTKGNSDGSWVSCLTGQGSQNVTHCQLCCTE